MGLGDDRTDHDLLEALPSGSVAGHVGGLLPASSSDGRPREYIRIESPGAVRAFLRTLAASIAAAEPQPTRRGRQSSG